MVEEVSGVWQSIAWPIAAFGGFTGFCLVFRPQIAGFIDRLTKVGVGNNTIETGPTPHQDTKIENEDRAVERIENVAAGVSRTGVPLHPGHATEVYEEAARSIPEIEERVRYLSNLVAVTNQHRNFEFLYRQIFGSQLDLMEVLNQNQRIPLSQVKATFEATRDARGLSGLPYENWIAFLTVHRLVAEVDGFLVIGPDGRDFLVYLVTNGYPLKKER